MYKTILINKNNKFKESYNKRLDLIEVKNYQDNNILIDKETYEHFKELRKELLNYNIKIAIDDSYRSIEHQLELKNKLLETYGEEYVNNFVAEPSYSEHHTGLAIDLELIDVEDDLKEETYKEVHKFLAKHGFILRYPKNKEDITRYAYEPWHIRYVGVVPATIISNNNLTLEEYLNDFSGVLYINKPIGVTSFDIVNEISKIFGIKKVGHTGTLDPIAEGVLIVCLGKATKIVELLTAKDKEYVAGVLLGIKTDTFDLDGKVIDNMPIPDKLPLEETIDSFKKTYLQQVPIYSAIKINGKKLYEYARNNIEVELPKKEVTIKEIELLSSEKTTFMFKTLVSKGTYIRSLINDICTSMNVFGTMSMLKRTKQGKVSIEDTNTIEDIKNNKYTLHSIEEVLDYQVIEIEEELLKKISSGVKIKNTFNIKDKVIFKYHHKILGIYEKDNDMLKVWKNFI